MLTVSACVGKVTPRIANLFPMSFASELIATATACGLTRGQVRKDGRIKNGIWFDVHWRMIGWGDLAEHDLVRLAKTLPFGSLFIVVNQTELQPFSHDIDTVSWLVERGSIYLVLRLSTHPGDETYENMLGTRFRKIIRPTAAGIVERFVRLNNR